MVYFYKEFFEDGTDEIITSCGVCAQKAVELGRNLEQIDKAGSFDFCDCGTENVPAWYSSEEARP